MNREERDSLRALLEQATPGPWVVGWPDPNCWVAFGHEEGSAGDHALVISAPHFVPEETEIPNVELIAAAVNALPGLLDALDHAEPAIDIAHLSRQKEWSRQTFGPGNRTAGVLAHIRKELDEVEENPDDVEEWADIIILALDGAWRAGWDPRQIINAIRTKQERNEKREWPDWRTMGQGEAIEHISPDAGAES